MSELSDSSKFRRPKDSLPAVDEIRAAMRRRARKVVKVDCNVMALEFVDICEAKSANLSCCIYCPIVSGGM